MFEWKLQPNKDIISILVVDEVEYTFLVSREDDGWASYCFVNGAKKRLPQIKKTALSATTYVETEIFSEIIKEEEVPNGTISKK